MRKHYSISLIFIFISVLSFGQKNIRKITRSADSLYQKKQFAQATNYYNQLIAISDFRSQKKSAAYNAACCLALQNKTDSAFILLNKTFELGGIDKNHLLADTDLTILHSSPKWAALTEEIKDKKTLNTNPSQAKFFTEDVHRFWKSYDLYLKDTANAYSVFKTHYFDKASVGMDDYMTLKVPSIQYFVDHIKKHPKFYASIQQSTLKVDDYKPEFYKSFKKLKEIYPKAEFPDVYFSIGALTSGGTVSPSGLLIGVNQICKDGNTNLDEMNFGQKLLINNLEGLPHLISHELIHFQQNGIKNDTITLGYAINEGMADFVGELISGKTANPQLLTWVKGKEYKVWQRFKKDMYLNRYSNWIGNYGNASEDNFPDLGYWVGYEICKSYYENAKDKKKAIYDMFHIQDYRKFLKDSHWEEKVERMKR